jgi:hypothetical protein
MSKQKAATNERCGRLLFFQRNPERLRLLKTRSPSLSRRQVGIFGYNSPFVRDRQTEQADTQPDAWSS